MSKHARLMSWVISSHNWDSPAGTPSLSQGLRNFIQVQLFVAPTVDTPASPIKKRRLF